MASSSIPDDVAKKSQADSEMLQFADKDSQASQHSSKPHYCKASTNLKQQPEVERPRFVEPTQDEAPTAGSDATHEAGSKLGDEVSEYCFTWPEFTDLVYSADGSINLKAQNIWTQNMLKTAVLELEKASLFDNAFPNITQKRKMALKAVHNATVKHKEYAIAKWVKHDFDYTVALASILEGQLSSFCTNLKKLAHQIVVSCFALKKGCTDEVEDLIKGHKYIFPTDAKGKVFGDQSFCDKSIIDTIQLSIFDGKNPIGVQSCQDFVSVLDGNDNPELPIAIVCLIATIIYAILKDWSSGNPPSSTQVKSFNASFHINVYKAHQATLSCIFDGSPKKYHVLMAHLYKAVSGAVESSAFTGSLNACDYLDLNAMNEE
ncbi:hypothetical protein BDR07DRAFT_1480546 [Suillus spraguei]|nr:hypothetical protein BDR07DRAFT_1480546 [Suillus spraguei]